MRVARGPLGIPLPSMAGPKTLCGVGAGTLRFLSRADMDLGVHLESPQGSEYSSPLGSCRCNFLPSCSGSVTLPFAWIKGSVAFPRGFPTKLSHWSVPRANVVCVDPRFESRGSAGKTGFPGMDGDIWGTLGMVTRPWNSSRLSCGECLLLSCDGNAGNSVPTT